MRYSGPLFVIVPLLIILFAAGCGGNEAVELEPLIGDITELANDFVNYLGEGEYNSAYSFFCGKMRNAMSERDLRRTWQQLQGQLGSYEEVVGERTEKVEEYDIVFLTTAFEEDLINIRIVFNEDRRISGLWFDPVEDY